MDLISEFTTGYRYFGYWSSPAKYGNQFKVANRNDVIKLVSEYNGIMNCGISICEYIDDVPYLLYLPFDFDSESLDKSWEDASTFYNYMIEDGYQITINFSGYKGFHCLIPVEHNLYSKKQIKNVQRYFKELLNLSTCDPAIFGDIRRLIRIPGTVHCGKFKRIKGKGWIRVGEGSYCETISHNIGNKLNLNELDTPEYPEYEFEESNGNGHSRNSNLWYPCIDEVMNEREPPQLIRYSYVAYRLLNGELPEDIINDLEDKHSEGKLYEWDDWNLDYTSNQVNHIASKGDYQPLSCKSLQTLGYCKNQCKLDINNWLKRRNVNDTTKEYELGKDV